MKVKITYSTALSPIEFIETRIYKSPSHGMVGLLRHGIIPSSDFACSLDEYRSIYISEKANRRADVEVLKDED